MILNNENSIDLFVGSKIGSLKHIKHFLDESKNSKKFTENLVDIKSLQKDDGITCMEWGNADQSDILIARKNKQIQVFNTHKSTVIKTYDVDVGSGHVVGLGQHGRTRLAALACGLVKLWTKKTQHVVETGGKLDVMRTCPSQTSVFVTGGEENDVKVWRIGEATPLFQAKNLPADWLQLRQPVWVSDACFLTPEAGVAPEWPSFLVASCSRHGWVRLYDARAQRRPVACVPCEGLSAVRVAPGRSPHHVLVGFARGQIRQVDLRTRRLDKAYEGAAGAVTALRLAPVAPRGPHRVVSVSLDRYLRVHDHETKRLIYKQYLTSKPCALLVQTEGSTPLRAAPKEEREEVAGSQGPEGGEGEEDMDALFGSMQPATPAGDRKQKLDPFHVEDCSSDSKKLRPSEGSSVSLDPEEGKERAIAALLLSTERQKRRAERRKRLKKAKSVFSRV